MHLLNLRTFKCYMITILKAMLSSASALPKIETRSHQLFEITRCPSNIMSPCQCTQTLDGLYGSPVFVRSLGAGQYPVYDT